MFCEKCGKEIDDEAVICVHCGCATVNYRNTMDAKSRAVYIILAVFLGGFGIHNFYIGRNRAGMFQLFITLFLGWLIFPMIVIFIWVIKDILTITKDSRGIKLS